MVLFHERRQFLLESLRLCFRIASDGFDADDVDLKSPFLTLIGLVLESKGDGTGGNGSSFWRRVLASMSEAEKSLQQLAARVQAVAMTGQVQSEEFTEMMDFQRTSLTRQHESLGGICHYVIVAGHINVDDFRVLLGTLKGIERYDTITAHYLPAFFTACAYFGSHEGRSTLEEGRALHNLITSNKDNEAWTSRIFQAAATCSWLAEYSARSTDQPDSPPPSSSDPAGSSDARSKLFLDALRDGAFQFLLSIAQDMRNNPWFDPLRKGLTTFLIQDSPSLVTEAFQSEQYMQDLFMEQLQGFVDAFITNMPDTLRILRLDEDEHRRQTQGRVQLRPTEYPLHLERFFMIASMAYDGFDHASENFWSDPDGNLYGFLVWASQRQPTPRVATFCELLRSLSYGEVCANHAHRFLLEDKGVNFNKLRRNSPLSWHHITGELEFYSSTVRDRPAVQHNKGQDDPTLVEPESEMMLECYLRLIAHLCQQSPAARAWFLAHPTFHLHEHLLLLCSSSIESRLRGNAFAALAALLVDKTREVGDGMWAAVDAWISGAGNNSQTIQRQSSLQTGSVSAERAIFELISTGFEEPNSFVGLLIALISPYPEETDLNDSLPFPESLGAAYRMPGIEPYVDFALGRLLAQKTVDLQDPIQVRILRCSCLTFAATCLSSFNEDLVVFANQSSTAVDSAMRTSSLAAYARLHPFARVIEWLFNDAVVAALMDTAIQDVREVNDATPNSPLILGLLQAIRVITLVLSLETTYFEFVRPNVKLQSTVRRQPVANSALVSFEDVILNNLSLVARLGLYCGSGHQDLAIASLQLLQRLTNSRKLSAPVVTSLGRQMDKSRLITALERNSDSETVAVSLALQMRFDERAIEQGPESPVCVIQNEILKFLNGCLETVPDRPTIAHSLLGYTCYAHALDVAPSGPFAEGSSLFHGILSYLILMPDGDPVTLLSWLVAVKLEAVGVIARLVRSPLSARFTLAELRASEYLFFQWTKQPRIGLETLWDGRSFEAPDFFVAESGSAFVAVLQQRAALLDYAAVEIQSVSADGLTSLKDRIISTLLGRASFLSGQQVPCLNLFDLVVVFESMTNDILPLPQTKFFDMQDVESCATSRGDAKTYDVPLAEQLLLLRSNAIRRSGQLSTPAEEQQMVADVENILFCLHANNRRVEIRASQSKVLKSWVQLVAVVLEKGGLDQIEKSSFVLQALQVVLPRLEQAYSDDTTSALLYAQLARTLLQQVDTSSAAKGSSLATDSTSDRFFQLFSIALIGIQDPRSSSELRLSCSQICLRYLRNIARAGDSTWRKSCMQSVTACGDGLIETLCDEAYTGSKDNRIAALLLLGALAATCNRDNSRALVDALTRINFINVLVNNLKHIPREYKSPESSGKSSARKSIQTLLT